jgi:predicted NBD/HSP70 family sugar kinase
VLSDLTGAPVKVVSTAGIGTLTPEEFIARIAAELRDFMHESGVPLDRIIGVGIANPGEIDSRDGRISWSSTMDPQYFSIVEAITDASGLPVVIENDAGCVALGEFWSGRMSSDQDFVTLYLASGVGFALMIDGALYRGASSNVGGFQHVVADPGGAECWCGSRGCLRTVSSPVAVIEAARRDPSLIDLVGPEDVGLALAGVGGSELYLGFRTLVEAANDGDEAAGRVVDTAARFLANAVLGLVNVLDLGKVVLAGPGFDDAGERYRALIAEALDTEALMRKRHGVQVELRRGGDELAALGAAAVVLHKLLTPHHDPQ